MSLVRELSGPQRNGARKRRKKRDSEGVRARTKDFENKVSNTCAMVRPAWVETHSFRHPQLRSVPDTSLMIVFAAWTAVSGSAEPILYIKLPSFSRCTGLLL